MIFYVVVRTINFMPDMLVMYDSLIPYQVCDIRKIRNRYRKTNLDELSANLDNLDKNSICVFESNIYRIVIRNSSVFRNCFNIIKIDLV